MCESMKFLKLEKWFFLAQMAKNTTNIVLTTLNNRFPCYILSYFVMKMLLDFSNVNHLF